MYFINPDGSDPNKPKQIWTQGETEASSCWFPTVDSPNQKSSQEMIITVDSIYQTLSNGALMFQTENGDGTRTDYWKQDLKHAPYLFMMAIGEYAIVEDEWNGIPVNYYVEKEYESHARNIFPNTVEMLQFYSDTLNYNYPWDKFDQIIVRDYVSGAMENTSAVIYGEVLQGDERYLVDYSGEDVVAHELFHHWFGDLITTESWSNIPLNESFATYGEFLWMQHKYGKDAAEYHLNKDLKRYLSDARISKKPMIRYHYSTRDDLFDTHTYQKGGRIVHMLRKYLGDELFFASLNKYLEKFAFKSAEIHDLRLVFEEVSGEDLNWFFNQWFFHSGHPEILVEKSFDDSTKTLSVDLIQKQEGDSVPNSFRLFTEIEVISVDGKIETFPIEIIERKQHFEFVLDYEPKIVKLDANNDLLAVIDQDISTEDAIYMYQKDNNYLDRYAAISLSKMKSDSLYFDVLLKALEDPFWKIRNLAIKSSKRLTEQRSEAFYAHLIRLANTDPKSSVRAEALSLIHI